MDTNTGEIYQEYEPQFFSGRKHPGCLIESAVLAAVTSPDYKNVDKKPIEDIPGLSSAQKDAVFLAVQQFCASKGKISGFLLGDGPGVGKSRVIAAIIKYYFDLHKNPDNKALWITVNQELSVQIKRELNSVDLINCDVRLLTGKQTENCGRYVFVTTYNALNSRGSSEGSSAMSKIEALLGENYSGLIILDECQRAKNLKESEKDSTTTGLMIQKLQMDFPKAKVVYSSATSISEPAHFLYMDRLSLWGESSQFSNFSEFSKTLTKRGMIAMESLIQHLKLTGKMIARKLSCKYVKCSVEKIEISPSWEEIYQQSTKLWRDALHMLDNAENRPGPARYARFWSAQQRFFKNLCLAMKVPKAIEIARKVTNEGCSVVFGIQSTGEAASKNSSKYGIESKAVCKYILYSTIVDVITPCLENTCFSEELLEKVMAINLPENFLDSLVDGLGGPEKVAEMTGRNFGNRTTQTSVSKSCQARERFQNGTVHVAVISDVASTGFSLHDDVQNNISRPRVHVTLELPWSAEKTIQQLGRTNRANQYTAPQYILLTTNVCGEIRFASAVVHKLHQMGALTHGCRQLLEDYGLSNYDVEYDDAVNSVTSLCAILNHDNPDPFTPQNISDIKVALEIVKFDINNPSRPNLFEQFLNRIFCLPIDKQKLVFDFFLKILDAQHSMTNTIKKANAEAILSTCEDIHGCRGLRRVEFLLDVSLPFSKCESVIDEEPLMVNSLRYGPAYVHRARSKSYQIFRPIDGYSKIEISETEYSEMRYEPWRGEKELFKQRWQSHFDRACKNCVFHGQENLKDFRTWAGRSCKFSKFTALEGDIWSHWNFVTSVLEEQSPAYLVFEDQDNKMHFCVLADPNVIDYI